MPYPLFSFSSTKSFIYKNPFIVVSSISLLWESAIFVLAAGKTLTLQDVIWAHTLVVLCLVLFVCIRMRKKEETYFPVLFTLSTAILGPLGALFALLLFLFHHKAPKSSNFSNHDLYESLLAELKKTEEDDLFENLVSGNIENFDKSSVIPFIDVLQYGNQRQKQTLIPLLINNYHRKFAPILREAIKNEDNSIRVLASMGMAQIESQFMKETLEIENRQKFSDKTNKNYYKTLGRHYDDYAYSEILDEILQTDYRNLAIKAYKEYLRFNPLDGDVLFWLSRAYLRNGNPEEAARNFEMALENKLLMPQNFVWYLESLYRLKEYEKLREVAQEYSRNLNISEGVIPPEINKVIHIWGLS